MGSATTKRQPSARNVVLRVCHAIAHRCHTARGEALADVDLYDVGHNAIDCNDDLHEAASNENALKEYVELVQSLKLTRGSRSEDGCHPRAVDGDFDCAAVSNAGCKQREKHLMVRRAQVDRRCLKRKRSYVEDKGCVGKLAVYET